MRVADVMSRELITVTVDTTAETALEEMRATGLHALPVVLEEVIAGVVTERDIRLSVIQAGRDPKTTAVAELMTRGLGTATPNELGANEAIAAIPEEGTLDEAISMMNHFAIDRLAVHDSDFQIVGIISRSDIEAIELATQE